MASLTATFPISPTDTLQGSPGFLSSPKFIVIFDSPSTAKNVGFFWSFCTGMGWRGRGNDANKATRGKHVSETMLLYEPQ